MICSKCYKEIQDDSAFCRYCGKKQITEKAKHSRRANGEGSIYKLPNGKYRAVKTQFLLDDEKTRKTVSKTFVRKVDAADWLKDIKSANIKTITLKAAYEKCIEGYSASRSTTNCYNAGIAVFKEFYGYDMKELAIDDLQGAIENCGKGKRTKQDAKTALGIVYKWAIPRGYADKNLAQYIKINDAEVSKKKGLTPEQLERVRKHIEKSVWAELVYDNCYLGFRPTEFLGLCVKDYNRAGKYFVGGIKTEAGKDRIVTVSPKIQPFIDERIKDKIANAYVFCDPDTGGELTIKKYRQEFYKLLAELKINNEGHPLTPHSCRHTFATLMKRVSAPDKDKLSLIGHTAAEQLRDYQDVILDDLRKITDAM